MKRIKNVIVFDNEAELLDFMSEFGKLIHIVETKDATVGFVYFIYEGGLELVVIHDKIDDEYSLLNTNTPRDSSLTLRLCQREDAEWRYDVI